MTKKGDGDFFLADRGCREGYQHGQGGKEVDAEIKHWRQLWWRDDLGAHANGGRCTLTEKSLGRGGEVMIPQREDIQAILKLSQQ